MPYSSKSRALSYAEVVRALTDNDVREDVNDACAKLSEAMCLMVDRFESVAKQMHTIDLQRLTLPIKPRWDTIRKEFGELLWQYRANAGFISGRLKLFCSAVLPMAARHVDGHSRRSHEEILQVLQSFMTISAEHAALTRSLVERALRLGTQLTAFHTEFAKFTSRQVTTGQKELYDLSIKICELEGQIRHVCITNAELINPDVTHMAFSTFRIVTSSGSRPGRSKIAHQRLALTDDLGSIGQAYESLDMKRNELAHAQYTAQLRHSNSTFLSTAQTTLSLLVCDVMLTFESGLGLFLAIWSRLRSDCSAMLQWISSSSPNAYPPVIGAYQESGKALYVTLAGALDICISGIDLSVIEKTT